MKKKDEKPKGKVVKMDATVEDDPTVVRVDNKNNLLLALSQGMTFTRACEISGNRVQMVSIEYLRSEPFRAECDSSNRGAASKLMVQYNDALQANKFSDAKDIMEALRALPQLRIWEMQCKKTESSNAAIAKAIIMTRDIKEAATVTGHTSEELIEQIMQNDAILNRVKEVIRDFKF